MGGGGRQSRRATASRGRAEKVRPGTPPTSSSATVDRRGLRPFPSHRLRRETDSSLLPAGEPPGPPRSAAPSQLTPRTDTTSTGRRGDEPTAARGRVGMGGDCRFSRVGRRADKSRAGDGGSDMAKAYVKIPKKRAEYRNEFLCSGGLPVSHPHARLL